MITVYKCKVTVGQNLFNLPHRAEILKFGAQDGNLFIWYLVNTEVETVTGKHVFIVGTGHEIPPGDFEYIDSCFDGPFVWHCFEEEMNGVVEH